MAQSQISRTLRGAAERERVAAILSQERFGSRRAFGRRICREFSFVDAAGRLQVSGCLKALSTLAGEDPGIVLPPPAAEAVDRTPRLLPDGVEEPSGVPPHPSQIRGLEIAAAASASDRALWNTLIAREHPRGLATCGGCPGISRRATASGLGWLRASSIRAMTGAACGPPASCASARRPGEG